MLAFFFKFWYSCNDVCFGVHVCENKLGLCLANSDLTVHSWLLLYWLWEHQVPVNDSWCVEWASKHSFIEIPFPMVRAYTECHWVIHTGNKRIVIFNNHLFFPPLEYVCLLFCLSFFLSFCLYSSIRPSFYPSIRGIHNAICVVYNLPKMKITVWEKKSRFQDFSVSTTLNVYCMYNVEYNV